LIPLSVEIFTKPSFGRVECDKDTASTTKTKQETSWSILSAKSSFCSAIFYKTEEKYGNVK
jgi:hypothetical protein